MPCRPPNRPTARNRDKSGDQPKLGSLLTAMDLVLKLADDYVYDPYFPEFAARFPSDTFFGILIKFTLVNQRSDPQEIAILAALMYYFFAGLSYYYYCVLYVDYYFPGREASKFEVKKVPTTLNGRKLLWRH